MTLNDIHGYYNQGQEQDRLTRGQGQLELVRTQEIIMRYLPKPPATVLDIGGGAGIYALWLAQMGYTVHLVDYVPLHVVQATRASARQPRHSLASATVGDARHLDFPDACAEAVLLLGPLYHLPERTDRLAALREAYRVLKPSGFLFAATISRFASLLDGMSKGYLADPHFADLVERDLVDGQHRNPTGQPGYFSTSYFHYPTEVPAELAEAGFQVETTLAIEGLVGFMPEYDRFWEDETLRERLLGFLRTVETDPSILGATGHIISVGRKQAATDDPDLHLVYPNRLPLPEINIEFGRQGVSAMHPLQKSETNRLLGYPDDARLLLINADDLGMYQAINDAVLRAFREGVVQSTSLMVPCPGAVQAMHMLRENPDIPVGVHLSIIHDINHYRWDPVAPRERIPSLLDESGHFYTLEQMGEMLAKARLDELEVEFRAQIETALAAGLKPTHLDWHCMVSGGRADMFDLTLGLAKEYGLALRVGSHPFIEQVQAAGLPANQYDLLDSFEVDIDTKPARYAQMLRELPAGLTEWAVHPSTGTPESQAIDPDGWRVRRSDFDFLISPEAREIIQQEGIILISYRPLQDVWQGRAI